MARDYEGRELGLARLAEAVNELDPVIGTWGGESRLPLQLLNRI